LDGLIATLQNICNCFVIILPDFVRYSPKHGFAGGALADQGQKFGSGSAGNLFVVPMSSQRVEFVLVRVNL
jgi:hypothetical protein